MLGLALVLGLLACSAQASLGPAAQRARGLAVPQTAGGRGPMSCSWACDADDAGASSSGLGAPPSPAQVFECWGQFRCGAGGGALEGWGVHGSRAGGRSMPVPAHLRVGPSLCACPSTPPHRAPLAAPARTCSFWCRSMPAPTGAGEGEPGLPAAPSNTTVEFSGLRCKGHFKTIAARGQRR